MNGKQCKEAAADRKAVFTCTTADAGGQRLVEFEENGNNVWRA